MVTVAEVIADHAGDDATALRFEDRRWSHAEVAAAVAARGALLADAPTDPPHVGVLLDNVPEFLFWLGAAALNRAVVVGINPTRRGPELERDIRATDCRWVVTDAEHLPLLAGIDAGVPPDRVLVVDDAAYQGRLDGYAGAPLPPPTARPDDLFVLFFTSGTTGTPKAVQCTQGRLRRAGTVLAGRFDLSGGVYQAMPMFHSNALLAGVSPAWAAGAPIVLRRRFSASGWLPDIRHYGATYFNYVGKPLAYILATPERDDDADNPLLAAFGNEANPWDIESFGRRFGCRVVDGYGSSEGGASLSRTPETPTQALGVVSTTSASSIPRRRPTALRPSSTPTDASSTPTRRSARSPPGRGRACSRATTTTPRPTPNGCTTGGTGPVTSPTATTTASCTSPAAATTGCASTARTSLPRPSRRSSPATPT